MLLLRIDAFPKGAKKSRVLSRHSQTDFSINKQAYQYAWLFFGQANRRPTFWVQKLNGFQPATTAGQEHMEPGNASAMMLLVSAKVVFCTSVTATAQRPSNSANTCLSFFHETGFPSHSHVPSLPPKNELKTYMEQGYCKLQLE